MVFAEGDKKAWRGLLSTQRKSLLRWPWNLKPGLQGLSQFPQYHFNAIQQRWVAAPIIRGPGVAAERWRLVEAGVTGLAAYCETHPGFDLI